MHVKYFKKKFPKLDGSKNVNKNISMIYDSYGSFHDPLVIP